MKDYSELTSRIYTQLSPELSQEFHNMLTDMASELSRLYEIDNAKPSEALECLEHIKKDDFNMIITTYPPLPAYNGVTKDEMFNKIQQALLKAQEQEKILSIIKEKDVDVKLLKLSTNWLDYYTRVKHKTGKNTELTEEEFELLKRWLNE